MRGVQDAYGMMQSNYLSTGPEYEKNKLLHTRELKRSLLASDLIVSHGLLQWEVEPNIHKDFSSPYLGGVHYPVLQSKGGNNWLIDKDLK